jgi:hypothetical protein
MSAEFKIYAGVDGVILQSKSYNTDFELEVWARRFLTFDYGNWSVVIDSDDIEDNAFKLNLWFTDKGSILFSCDNYCEENKDEENEEEYINECCKYKDFEITDNFSMENDYFTIKLIKKQPQTTQQTSALPEEFKIGIKPNETTFQAKLKETEFNLKAQRSNFFRLYRLNYNNWSIFIDSFINSNDTDYTDNAEYNLTMQFTDNGKILFTCDNHNENTNEYQIDNYEEIKNGPFTIAFYSDNDSEEN